MQNSVGSIAHFNCAYIPWHPTGFYLPFRTSLEFILPNPRSSLSCWSSFPKFLVQMAYKHHALVISLNSFSLMQVPRTGQLKAITQGDACLVMSALRKQKQNHEFSASLGQIEVPDQPGLHREALFKRGRRTLTGRNMGRGRHYEDGQNGLAIQSKGINMLGQYLLLLPSNPALAS